MDLFAKVVNSSYLQKNRCHFLDFVHKKWRFQIIFV